MVILYILAPVYSHVFAGGVRHSVALIWLGMWYNNWGGADKNPVIRNIINGLGYTCFASGAMEVALGGSWVSLHPLGWLGQWLLVIIGVIFSTVQLQDMSDQPGDAKRGRRTVPLVWGDTAARWTIALPMLCWGIGCPMFWGVSWLWFAISITLASLVALRTLMVRSVQGDKQTFRLWNCWIAITYMLPLFSEGGSLQGRLSSHVG
ncbi:hypothetical protein PDIG_28260 [Penicillium digitatum PHI26]|uniref:Uncharacterized protein n=2 Tax=Penicillium digitatum TaxID=36651 RepID=K9FZL8_PEND2|nr:hypothetical protein PDIP_62700 [Penicillium digitatum Pd1]EKV09938.1 hypothetical protein PDIP_62700 [Penicillium digitatum Pd1]EKV15145.1 hypothetical protein PDIG_28260 [Penicillium digitatum PHI26]